ncbi:hypothetical protein Tco_0383823, partial [Tanacetum coccineum]
MNRIRVLLVGNDENGSNDEAHASRFQDVKLARIYIDEIIARDGILVMIKLRFGWIIYLVVLADAAESVSDAIRFEYCLASS